MFVTRETSEKRSFMTSQDLEDRLKMLETYISHPTIPGTTISRVLTPDDGMQWQLGVGALTLPKNFFTAPSIEECLQKAENHYYEIPKPKEREKTKRFHLMCP